MPLLPELHGVFVVAGSDHGAPAVVDRIGETEPPTPGCPDDAYGGIALTADVAPDPGDETVLASFSHGVVVLGADGRRIAAAPGFACLGSQDALVAIEVLRTSLDAPVIAFAATRGGRRESSTRLELFAVGSSDVLDRLFVGEIETHDDQGTHIGDVTFIPGGLIYRHPSNGVSVWKYDATVHRYVAWRSFAPASAEGRPGASVDRL